MCIPRTQMTLGLLGKGVVSAVDLQKKRFLGL